MGKTVLSLRDEQPTGALGGNPRGTPGRVHGGVREGECGREINKIRNYESAFQNISSS